MSLRTPLVPLRRGANVDDAITFPSATHDTVVVRQSPFTDAVVVVAVSRLQCTTSLRKNCTAVQQCAMCVRARARACVCVRQYHSVGARWRQQGKCISVMLCESASVSDCATVRKRVRMGA